MNSMRWDPILQEWVVVAVNRNVRPILGKTFDEDKKGKEESKKEIAPKIEKKEPESKKEYKCPFCPGSAEVKDGNWDALQLGNRFAALQIDPEKEWVEEENTIFPTTPALGQCEVILYTPEHFKQITGNSIDQLTSLTKLWQDRYNIISENEMLKYIFIFENRGKEIGVSLEHPHGQIYSFPFIPPKLLKEWNSLNEYHEKTGKCLYCDVLEKEINEKIRIITENDNFVAFCPYFNHWPYEVHIYSKEHVPSIGEFNQDQLQDFAKILKIIIEKYDLLKEGIMPYVMSQHNAPSNTEGREKWHFHVEFYPIFRGPGRLKYLAGVELGCNTFINPLSPEQAAETLRNINSKD